MRWKKIQIWKALRKKGRRNCRGIWMHWAQGLFYGAPRCVCGLLILLQQIIGILVLHGGLVARHLFCRLRIPRKPRIRNGLLQIRQRINVLSLQICYFILIVGFHGDFLTICHTSVDTIHSQLLVQIPLRHHVVDICLPRRVLIGHPRLYLLFSVCIRCLLHRKLEVEVLDALSITASLLRGDYSTAGSVMFLLTVGSLLEEWTRKKSLDDLARSMALNVDKVWVRTPQGEVLVPLTRVHAGDEVVVRSGNMIPLDGMVLEGEAMVNQAALTEKSTIKMEMARVTLRVKA